MISLETNRGELSARVFVTDDERAVGIILAKAAQVIDSLRIESPNREDALKAFDDWLKQMGLEILDGVLLLRIAVTDEFKELETIRREGTPSSWLGSPTSRRLDPSVSVLA